MSVREENHVKTQEAIEETEPIGEELPVEETEGY